MRKKRKISEKQKYAILVDGETESWYIQKLKDKEQLTSIDLKPELFQQKKISKQFDEVIELSKVYDKVYWIIDFDMINKESKEAKKGEKNALQKLKEFVFKVKQKKYTNIVLVLINNPCFEYWLLLHFEKTSKFYKCYSNLEKQLKKYLPDYEKSVKYYKKHNQDIYSRLHSNLQTALDNAKKFDKFDLNKNPDTGVSQMYYLLEDILNK